MIPEKPLACPKQSQKTGKILGFMMKRLSIAGSKQTYEDDSLQLQIPFLSMTDVLLGLFMSPA